MRASRLLRGGWWLPAALALLAGAPPGSAQPAGEKAPPRLSPDEVIRAWQNAGARVGWMRREAVGLDWWWVPENVRVGSDIRVFQFLPGTEGRLSKLPAPPMGFALNLVYAKITDEGLKELARMKELQALRLDRTAVTDAGLKHLAGLTKLHTLDLGETRVTDAGMKHLAGLTNLQTLSLYRTGLTDAGLKELTGLKKLGVLFLFETKVTELGLRHLTGNRIKDLRLPPVPRTEVGLGHYLAAVEPPAVLHLRPWNVTDAGLKALRGQDRLHTLHLSPGITDGGLKELRSLTGLRTLHIADARVTDGGLKELAGLKLQEIHLPGGALTDVGLRHYLAAVEPRAALDLRPWNVTDVGLKALRGQDRLHTLHLGPGVTDGGLKELRALAGLHTLSLGRTRVTDGGLKELAGLKLKQLHVPVGATTDLGLRHYLAAVESHAALPLGGWEHLTDEGLKTIGRLKGVRTLHLGGARVTDRGLEHLAGLGLAEFHPPPQARTDVGLVHYLAALAPTTALDLTSWKVTDAGLRALAGRKGLQSLALNNTPVTDAGLKELRGFAGLSALFLDGTRVGDEGLKELKGLENLRTLHLSGTAVTGEGLKELTGLKNLQTLYLMRTRVGDEGMKHVGALANLQTLYLTSTPVTAAGLKELVGLKQLRMLEIASTRMPPGAARELRKALPKCRIIGR